MTIKKIAYIAIVALNLYSYVALSRVPALYLENYYGATVRCIINNTRIIDIKSDYLPIWLGEAQITGQQNNIRTVKSLGITTAYYGTTPLSKILNDIATQYPQNTQKDAVLIVKPTGYMSQWDIQLIWRNPNSVVSSFSMQSPEEEEKTIERQLQKGKISPQQFLIKIVNQLYGYDTAQKVQIMSNIDYEKAQKKHYKNLEAYAKLKNFGYPVLLSVLSGLAFNYQLYLEKPDVQYTQPYNRSPEEVRGFIKQLVDQQYALFLTYKKNGWLE